MLDAARALAANATVMEDAASDLADRVLREIERLEALHVALRVFIEQPQEAPARSEPGAPSPGASQPAPSVAGNGVAEVARAAATPTQPPAGERRTVRSRDLPTSATTPSAASTCPECGHRAISEAGLAVHRGRKHGVAGKNARARAKAGQPVTPERLAPDPAVFPDAPPAAYMDDGVMVLGGEAWTPEEWAGEWGKARRARNGHAGRSEKFLCGHCNRTFLSRSARDTHETQVDCQPVPTRPPMGREELVLPGSTQARGLGE